MSVRLSPTSLVEAFVSKKGSEGQQRSPNEPAPSSSKLIAPPSPSSHEGWIERKVAEAKAKAAADRMATPRIIQRSAASEAVWIIAQQRAKVVRRAGKNCDSFGHSEGGHLVLDCNEALFLVETEALVLFRAHGRAGSPFSLQEVYNLCLPNERAFVEYRVFSHLAAMGYRMRKIRPKRGQNKAASSSPNLPDASQNLLKMSKRRRPHKWLRNQLYFPFPNLINSFSTATIRVPPKELLPER